MLSKLKLAREAQGLRQKDLADAVFISRQFLALLETGRRRPSAETARKLAEALGVDGEWLFGRA